MPGPHKHLKVRALDAPKCILETEKTLKTLYWENIFKKPRKTPKKTKKPTGLGLKKTGFFQPWCNWLIT
jgi:hypothetical protein